MSINIWTFTGRLGQDCTVRTVQDTKAAQFSVAVDIGYGDKKTTMWVDCTLWGDRGEKLSPYLKKGTAVGVSGQAGVRSYEKNGQTIPVITCRVNDVALMGSKDDGATGGAKPAQTHVQAHDDPEDSIPF